METIVDPKRSVIPRVTGSSKLLCEMETGGVYSLMSL